MNKPKIVLFDLEIIPDLPMALRYWPELSCRWDNKTMSVNVTSICCVGWKIHGEKTTHCINAWDYVSWDKDVNDDYTVCAEIYEVLKHADAVVTHNGIKFDWPYLQAKLMKHGFPPLQNIHHIDTLKLVKKNLKIINNRMGTIGEYLVGDKKLAHTGWKLWEDTHNKDPKAMKLMEKYCIQDVNLLDKILTKLKPFVKNLPNRNNFKTEKQRNEGDILCPSCGSDEIKFNGYRTTKTQTYRRYYCADCGSWSRTNKNDTMPRTY